MVFAKYSLSWPHNEKGSPLRDVKQQKSLQNFLVHLDKLPLIVKETGEVEEVIEQEAVLEFGELDISTIVNLKELIIDLTHNLLEWYHKRYHNVTIQRRKSYEKFGFFPTLLPCHSLSIEGKVIFYNIHKSKNQYVTEKIIKFNLSHLCIKRLSTVSSFKNIIEDICTCFEYEYNKVDNLNTLSFVLMCVNISYVIKQTASISEEHSI